MVRNSVGSNCYVADEIITSRNGIRLRVGNTDAEVIVTTPHYYILLFDNLVHFLKESILLNLKVAR